MAKINLVKPLKTLNGEVIKDENGVEVMMSRFIANRIVGTKCATPVVALELANRLYFAKGQIDVSAIELTIIEVAAKSEDLPVLSSGQILKELGESKE